MRQRPANASLRSSTESSSAAPAGAAPRLVLTLLLLALLGTGLSNLHTPPPVSADAPTTEFSAERAGRHLSALAQESRAIGTPGHDSARRYLLDQLEAMGLEPEAFSKYLSCYQMLMQQHP